MLTRIIRLSGSKLAELQGSHLWTTRAAAVIPVVIALAPACPDDAVVPAASVRLVW
jgi:hypothetical protein